MAAHPENHSAPRRTSVLLRILLGCLPTLCAIALFVALLPPHSRPADGRAPCAGQSCAASCKQVRTDADQNGGSGEAAERGITGRETADRECPEEKSFSRVPGDGRAVRAPNPWFFLERAYPFDRIPRVEWQQAQLQARALKDQRSDRGTWDFRGPTNIGGRITDLAVDPVDPAVVFAAAAEGGILRTTDSGQHWTPLFDTQTSLSVGAIALDPSNSQVVYAGTGEVNPGGGSVAYGGDGVLRSTDHGDTWTPLGLETVGSIGRIRIDPTDPLRIYVAAMGDLWSKGPDRGVYRSTDGGGSWQKVLAISDSTGAVDLVIRPDQPRTIFAAMWERIRHPSYYRYGGPTCGVYKSTDGGDTWTRVSGGLPTPSSGSGRIGLAICTSSPNVMCAAYADNVGYFTGVYRSTDGGTTWTRTNDGGISDVFASYGWWFGNVRISPVDPNRIWVLGLPVYRSTNGGSTWSDVTGSMHVDHHAMEFGPGANPVIYDGNDGGIYRSTNGGSAWSFLPNEPITQIYRVALDAMNPNALYCGAQDNGTPRTLTGNLNDWVDIFGGDGFQPLVYPTNSSRIWAQYQYGSLGYSSNGGSSWVDATGGISSGDRHNWNTPVRFDPTNPSRMYYGTQRVYRSTNGTSWSSISPDLTGGGGGYPNFGTVTTIDVSPQDGQVIWAGTDDGHVQVTTNGGTNWTNVTGTLPNRWITSVRTHPLTRTACYVTVSGFRWGSPLPHIFFTSDMGSTWTPIEGNLPQAPVNDVIIDPSNTQRLFAATDVGVYQTYDGGATWDVLGSNLPNVVVTQLAFDPVARKLVAATYGRSFFSYNIDQTNAVAVAPATKPLPLVALSPNPTREGTWISWQGAAGGSVRAEVYTVSGRKVWSSELSSKDPSAPRGISGRLWWPGSDLRGGRVAPGAYFCRLHAGNQDLGGRTIVVLP